MSETDITNEAEALALATRIAAGTGLQLLPIGARERTQYGALTRMQLRGRLSGVGVDFVLRFLDAGPIAELTAAIDVELTRKWVDMLVVGRGMPAPILVPGAYSLDIVSEFSVRTDDDDYVAALLSGDVEKVLLGASYAGYRPRLDHDSLHMAALALDPPGAEKLLRHAVRLGSFLEARLGQIAKPKRELELLAALESVEQGMDGRLDRDALQLEIRRVEGTLVLTVLHHAYEEWSTAIELLFDRPLPVKMSLAPVRAFYENWFRPDIETGDRAFDRAFTVRGEPEERVAALLGESSRRALEAVVANGRDVLVTQDGINLQLPGVILDAAKARELLERVFGLADALTTHASGPQAYR